MSCGRHKAWSRGAGADVAESLVSAPPRLGAVNRWSSGADCGHGAASVGCYPFYGDGAVHRQTWFGRAPSRTKLGPVDGIVAARRRLDGVMPAEASGDLVASGRPPRAPRAPLYTGPRPGRRVVVCAAVLVVGLGLAARHVLWRTDTDHHGGVLTVIVANEFWFPAGFNTFDPAIQNSEWHSRLAAMTNNGLVGFRRAGGSHGAEIVPDLATTMPTRTNGGLTYTFHLRKGLRYSTGAPVLAGDIRRGIERTIVHPDTNESAVFYSSAIVAAQACLPAAEGQDWVTDPRPDCDLREGISTDDRTGTVTFHLTEAGARLPQRAGAARSRRRSAGHPRRPAGGHDTARDRAVPDPPSDTDVRPGERSPAARAGAQPALPGVVLCCPARRVPGPGRPRDRLHQQRSRGAGDATDAPTCSGSVQR